MADDEEACWICLAGAEEEEQEQEQQRQQQQQVAGEAGATTTSGRPSSLGPLLQVCACPRKVHASCCARWQLHSAGKSEEQTCRFCGEKVRLDYRNVMRAAAGARRVAPYMRVSFGGRTHKVPVAPGAEGAAQFEREIRRLLRLPASVDFDVIFHCRDVFSGDRLKLQGLCAYDAAVTCASLAPPPASRAAPAAGGGGAGASTAPQGGREEAAAAAAGRDHHHHHDHHYHDSGSGSGSSSGSDYGGSSGGGNGGGGGSVRAAVSGDGRAPLALGARCSERRRSAGAVAAAAATAAVAASAEARRRRRVSFEDEEEEGEGGRRGAGGGGGGGGGFGGRRGAGALARLWSRVSIGGFLERALLGMVPSN